jgi:hypothetical protein
MKTKVSNNLKFFNIQGIEAHVVSLYIYVTAIKFCKHRSKIWYTSLCKKGHFGVLNLHWFSLNWIFFVLCELSECFTRRGLGFCHWRIKGADNTTQTAFQCRLLGHKAGIKGDRGNWGNPNLWYSLPGAMSWLRRREGGKGWGAWQQQVQRNKSGSVASKSLCHTNYLCGSHPVDLVLLPLHTKAEEHSPLLSQMCCCSGLAGWWSKCTWHFAT